MADVLVLDRKWDKLGRLCLGIGTGDKGPQKQRAKGTSIFVVIQYKDTPKSKRGDICHTRVVYEVQSEKDDPNKTCVTVEGGDILYPGEVTTPTGLLEIIILVITSFLSQPGAQFMCFNINNFHLDTPLEDSEYVRVKLNDIP